MMIFLRLYACIISIISISISITITISGSIIISIISMWMLVYLCELHVCVYVCL